jgi:aprataxin
VAPFSGTRTPISHTPAARVSRKSTTRPHEWRKREMRVPNAQRLAKSLVEEMIAASRAAPAKRMYKGNSRGDLVSDDRKAGLGQYLRDPAAHPQVIDYNDDFVVIRDLYPKATVHLLILPRDPAKQHQHPLEAFKDSAFFEKLKKETSKWHTLAAKELARTLCPSNIPVPNRNWEAEIKVGIHSVPSMHHLHIHVISRDMHSPCLKHRKHYNSFNTSFFVRLDEIPLTEEEADERKRDWHTRDMICWRCKRNFGNRFTALKEHLETEFEEWKGDLIKPLEEEKSDKV